MLTVLKKKKKLAKNLDLYMSSIDMMKIMKWNKMRELRTLNRRNLLNDELSTIEVS